VDPLVTPRHIVPEWYFLVWYSVLRCVSSKALGVFLLAFCVVVGILSYWHFVDGVQVGVVFLMYLAPMTCGIQVSAIHKCRSSPACRRGTGCKTSPWGSLQLTWISSMSPMCLLQYRMMLLSCVRHQEGTDRFFVVWSGKHGGCGVVVCGLVWGGVWSRLQYNITKCGDRPKCTMMT
jgi:hypothetical protein